LSYFLSKSAYDFFYIVVQLFKLQISSEKILYYSIYGEIDIIIMSHYVQTYLALYNFITFLMIYKVFFH